MKVVEKNGILKKGAWRPIIKTQKQPMYTCD